MSQKRILIVDDEPSIRFLLSAVVEQADYTADVAEDGFSALRKIQESKPDLVITDLRMPNMNGFELLSVIRSRFPEIPTIAVSGEFLACTIDQGPLADAFFQKGNYFHSGIFGKNFRFAWKATGSQGACGSRRVYLAADRRCPGYAYLCGMLAIIPDRSLRRASRISEANNLYFLWSATRYSTSCCRDGSGFEPIISYSHRTLHISRKGTFRCRSRTGASSISNG